MDSIYKKIKVATILLIVICIVFFVFTDNANGYTIIIPEIICDNVYSENLVVHAEITTIMDDFGYYDYFVLLRSTEKNGPYYVADTIKGYDVKTNNKKWYAEDKSAPIGTKLYYKVFVSRRHVPGETWGDSEIQKYMVSYYSICEFEYTLEATTPQAPQFIDIASKDNAKAHIRWNVMDNVKGYKLYKLNNDSGEYELLKTFNHDYNYTWTDETTIAGQKNVYKVSSFTKDGQGNILESELSDSIEIIPKPKTPKLKLRVVGTQSVKLSWNEIEGVDGYRIYRYDSSNKKYKLIKTVKDGTIVSWKNTKLTTGKKYTYKITSYVEDAFGNKVESSKSEKKSATPRRNKYTVKPDPYFYDDEYGEIILRTKEVSYVDGKLQYKALALNNRIFYANKFDWVDISVYDGLELIASQKFYNRSIGLSGYNSKTMTFVFDKGTIDKNCNLRYADIDVFYNYVYTYNY